MTTTDAARLLQYLPDYWGDADDIDPIVAAQLDAQGAEATLRRDDLERIRASYVPARATDDLGAITRWENVLDLPPAPTGSTESQRVAAIVAALIARRAVGKGTWAQAVTRVLGTDQWTAKENTPAAYQLEFSMPYGHSTPSASRAETLIRRVTPANLDIVFRYADRGFVVGVSRVGDAI